MAVTKNPETGWAKKALACWPYVLASLLVFNVSPAFAQEDGDQDEGGVKHRHHYHHSAESRQENFFRGETEADRLYREANRARFDWEAEKARSLFEEAVKAEGSARAKYKSRICLKCYIPKYPVSPDCEKAFKAADMLIQENKLSDALAAFQDLAQKYPKFEWIQLELATIHLKNEDPERAATCARRALAINPDYVDAWMILAHECLMHHDMEGARVTTQAAHELDPFSDVVSKAVSMIDDELAKKKPD